MCRYEENLQSSRVGAGGRKKRASLQGRALRAGPGFCRHFGPLPSASQVRLPPGAPPPTQICHLRGLRLAFSWFWKCKPHSKQTHLLSWIPIFSFFWFCFVCFVFFTKPFALPEKFILLFKVRRENDFPSPKAIDVIAPPEHPSSESVPSGGPSGGRARAPCRWTCVASSLLSRDLLRTAAPSALHSCSFYFPQLPTHSPEL